MMAIEVIQTPPMHAIENMALDAELLESLAAHPRSLLHLYEWSGNSLTYGYFLDPYKYLRPDGVSQLGVQIARRPTGGGIIFHHCDLAFSVLIPANHPRFSINTLENYALVNDAVLRTIERYQGCSAELLNQDPVAPDEASHHFCMAKPTKYDVIIQGKKVGGGAQRKTKHGLLHQGSIAISLPHPDYLKALLLPDTCVANAMIANSYPLLEPGACQQTFLHIKNEIKNFLIHEMEKTL